MFDPGEAFFLGRGKNLAIVQKCCGAVMVISGNAEDVHVATLKNGVYKRCHGGTLAEYNQATKDDKHYEDR